MRVLPLLFAVVACSGKQDGDSDSDGGLPFEFDDQCTDFAQYAGCEATGEHTDSEGDVRSMTWRWDEEGHLYYVDIGAAFYGYLSTWEGGSMVEERMVTGQGEPSQYMYTYDDDGRMTSWTDGYFSTSMTYGEDGLPAEEQGMAGDEVRSRCRYAWSPVDGDVYTFEFICVDGLGNDVLVQEGSRRKQLGVVSNGRSLPFLGLMPGRVVGQYLEIRTVDDGTGLDRRVTHRPDCQPLSAEWTFDGEGGGTREWTYDHEIGRASCRERV